VQAYRVHVLALAGRNRLGRRGGWRRTSMRCRRRWPGRSSPPPSPAPATRARASRSSPPRWQHRARLLGRRFGSACATLLAVAVLLRESGVAADRLPNLLGRLPGADLTPAVTNTQEQAWAVAAAGVLGRDGRPVRVTLNDRDLPTAAVAGAALAATGTARNRGEAPVVQAVSITGVPTSPLPAAAQGMRVARRFLGLDGQPLNLDALRAGTNFILLMETRATTGERHQAMVLQGLPAGWEITGRIPAGEAQGMPWLGTLTETEAMPARDDRFAAAVTLTPQEPLSRLAVRLRAVTPGRFELPGMEAQDMYRPGVHARQNSGRITVLGADDPLPAPPPPVAPPRPATR
jgi:uncharacterized protein YfaS (alpha-2-macroglobulin family)